MAEILKVIGLMSGTSLDGVDAAILDTDGETVAVAGSALTIPYEPAQRKVLREALTIAPSLPTNDNANSTIRTATTVVNLVHVAAVEDVLRQAKLTPSDIAYVGFHGQTVLHRPEQRRTWQIGDGATLAKTCGIAVVNDFRSADVAAGGQGAPFVPLYHQALVREMKRPVVVVNIGGVANVTYVGASSDPIAFDTGPGNATLDDWALLHTGVPVDRDGKLARAGRVNEAVLAAMLENPIFERKPPKSLDRLDFPMDAVRELSPADGAATLTAFTAAAIGRAAEHFPGAAKAWIMCGGGRHNPVLMEELLQRLSADVLTAEDAGWRGDFLEAEAFAYLAVRSVKGLPLSLPSTTGVPCPMPGGTLHVPLRA